MTICRSAEVRAHADVTAAAIPILGDAMGQANEREPVDVHCPLPAGLGAALVKPTHRCAFRGCREAVSLAPECG